MNTTKVAASDLRKAVVRAKRWALADFRSGKVEHEPALTDRLAAYLQRAVETKKSVFKWDGKTLTDRAANSQESKYGADLLGALHIDTPEYKVSKGFLAQAKLIREGKAFTKADAEDLREQCEKMLALSDASFVFIYTSKEIRVVPAKAVISSSLRDPLEFNASTLESFFEAHAQCFIGDLRIRAASPEQLERLREDYSARTAVLLRATPPPVLSEFFEVEPLE